MTLVMHLCSPCNRRTINFYDDDDDAYKTKFFPAEIKFFSVTEFCFTHVTRNLGPRQVLVRLDLL